MNKELEILKKDLKHLLKSKRKQFGIVPQNVRLFNKSIYENIALNREISLSEVKKYANIVNIDNDCQL